jgi:hypothetical protein
MVSQKYLGAFPNMFWHKFGHFLYISLGAACLCSLGVKIKAKTKQKPPESHLQMFVQTYHFQPNSN